MSKKFTAVPATLLFEYDTIEKLAHYFVDNHRQSLLEVLKVTPKTEPRQTSQSQNVIKPARHRFQDKVSAPQLHYSAPKNHPEVTSADVAIIGLSGRYPQAQTLTEFWQNLKTGRNCITEIPQERWNHTPYYDPDKGQLGRTACKWGGFIEGYDQFDPLFFNISPREAEWMDPQARLFLEIAWETVEDAGYTRDQLKHQASGRQVGVYVGVMHRDYPFVTHTTEAAALLASSNTLALIANRVSHFFDFQGPSLVVDTACSASLTAIHLACDSIRRRECDLALAGGVNLSLHPAKWLAYSQGQLLGSESRSKSLGDGDGYLPGEGVGAVLLKRLDQAIADNDQIYAIIKGGSLNHGGKTVGLSTPNPNAQADLLRQTFAKTGVEPQTISYVEVAANGSALGDSIEVAGLSQAFQAAGNGQTRRCPIGSVKSNIGHLEAASGISQLTKVILQLKHQTLVPSINAEPVNPHLNLAQSPFYIQKEVKPWPRSAIEQGGETIELPRRAAISSFGAGGANAHLVVEEYQGLEGRGRGSGKLLTDPVSSAHEPLDPSAQLVVLSAKNESRLRVYAQKLLAFLENETEISLVELAYTLQAGREAMAERLAFVVHNKDQLRQGLNTYLNGGQMRSSAVTLFTGNAELSKEEARILAGGYLGQDIIGRSFKVRDWERLAVLWIKGVTIPWEQLYGPDHPRRISLPTYPFERKRYWLTDSDPGSNSYQPSVLFQDDPSSGIIPFDSNAARTDQETIQAYLVSLVAQLLKIAETDLKPDKALYDYGLDSMIGMQLRRRLEANFAIKLTGRELLETGTLRVLAELLTKKLAEMAMSPLPQPSPTGIQERTGCSDRPDSEAALASSPSPRPSPLGGGSKASLPMGPVLSEVEGGSEARLCAPEAEARDGLVQAPSLEIASPTLVKMPLSEGQKGLWLLQKMTLEMSAYNVPLALRFRQQLDPELWHEALRRLVAHYPILQTVIQEEYGQPVQVIDPSLPLSVKVDDIGRLQEAEVIPYLKTTVQEPFDLQTGPLLRLQLFTRSEREYILLLTIHHIIIDGTSMGGLLKSLLALYQTLAKGTEANLTPVEGSYHDFVIWEQELLAGEEGNQLLAYWLEQISGEVPHLRLPLDRPRPPVQSYRGETVESHLNTDLTRQVRALAKANRVNMATLFMAIFKVLLYRYTGQADILIGTPSAGRPQQRFETTIGYFINMVVIRSQVDATASFLDYLKELQMVMVDALDHSAYPFPRLVAELEVNPDPALSPLFQVAFAFQNFIRATELQVLDRSDQERLPFDLLDEIHSVGEFDLRLEISEAEASYCLQLKYNPDLFDPSTIERMLGHYIQLMTEIVAAPDKAISGYDFLSAAEQQQLLVDWNETQAEYLQDKCIHHQFEAQVERMPEAVAVVFEDQSLTYRELNDKANQLAHHLIDLGVGSDALVGLCVERSLHMIVGVLGILKAGGAYLPLDPTYPAERLAFMIDDAKPLVVLSQASLLSLLSEQPVDLVCLDTEWTTISQHNQMAPACSVRANHLAYVLYTSGSTGTPKGVMVEHRNVVNFLHAFEAIAPGYTPQRGISICHLTFDVSVWELFSMLCFGGTLHLLDPVSYAWSDKLAEYLLREKITTAYLHPMTLTDVQSHLAQAEQPLLLERLLVGVEPIKQKVLQGFREQSDRLQIINGYGPTETTVCATFYRFDGASEGEHPTPIGQALKNYQIYLLDGHRQPVPIGVPGELYIGGDGVSRGYLNRPELTEEKFIANPFGEGRLYRTGDLARYRSDGNIEFVGRIDHQVKVRGYRIELGEIETVLNQSPTVDNCVVLAREDAPGDKRLVAYLVACDPYQHIETGQVEQWQTTFEQAYQQSAELPDPTFNITGWQSSYTGQPIPASEMEQWVEAAVTQIMTLEPERVVEIGCGTGLLLARIAPHCQVYHGTDYSQEALAYVGGLQQTMPELAHVTLSQRMADDFSGLDPHSFDTIILNSVVQYFPSIDYLLTVLEGAMQVLKPGGRIYLGDVRSLPLLEAYHASVQFYQADDSLSSAELRQQVQQQLLDENELVIDPDFFRALRQQWPQISRVEIQPKAGQAHNELTRFRYEVILHLAEENQTLSDPISNSEAAAIEWLDWTQQQLTLTKVRQQLAERQPARLGVRGVPNSRLVEECQLLTWLATSKPDQSIVQLRQQPALEPMAVEPEQFWDLSEELPYRVMVTWSAVEPEQGRLDVIFIRHDVPETIEPEVLPLRPWSAYGNNPLRGQLSRELIPTLRAHLQAQLPDYMVPSALVLLDSFPLTPNGKIDRQALPAPQWRAEVDYVAPRTPTQENLVAIWAEVLGLERVGIHDDFFDLGGHSLLATQLISRIRNHFQVELPLRQVFEYPTVAKLVAQMEQALPTALPPIEPISRSERLPLSFAQQRLWFLDQLGTGSAYNMPVALKLSGALNIAALQQALQSIVERHEALRTTFTTVAGQAEQVIVSHVTVELPVVAVEAEMVPTLAQEEALTPFDLSRDLMLRVQLLQLAAEEHVLLVTFHHIASDGWSMGVFLRELTALYQAYCDNKSSLLAPLPIQYADFAHWQRQWLQDDVLSRQLDYWQTQLAGVPEISSLPTDRPRPAVQTFQGSAIPVILSPELTEPVRQLSRQAGTTLFMSLLAAFKVLLYRYSGQTDIVVGSAIANRTRQEIEGLIGFFVNTMVLRSNLAGDPSFTELLEQVKAVTQAAYEHQDVPFEHLVEALQPERHLSHNPLVQVNFILQNAPLAPFSLPGLEVSPLAMEVERTRFDLELHLREVDDGLQGLLIYNSDLFEETTMRRFIGHYRTLLRSIVADADQPIAALPLLTATERQQLLVEWNETQAKYPQDECIHHLFEAQVQHTPEAVALVFEEQQLTYRELNDKANQLAHHLRSLGVGHDDLVGICVERSLEMIVGLLGILKAGGAYVPLDPTYPAERLAFMIDDAQLSLLLAQSWLEAEPASEPIQRIDLDTIGPLLADRPHANPVHQTEAHHLAYVIYTSGSTGRPKGVMVEHRSLSNLAQAQIQAFGLGPDSRVLQFAAFSFDASVSEIFTTLLSGARLILATQEDLMPGQGLLGLLRREAITTVTLPPSALAALPVEPLPALQTLVSAGEACSTELVNQWAPGRRFLNAYGPTENTVCATVAVCREGDDRPPLIGRPIANVEIYIVDDRLQPVPVGVPGELCIGGASLARGYLNRPELTTEKFIANPFGEGRLYRTGDLARYRSDSNIEFLGRIDHQVKLRGYRIELGEIEAQLSHHPSVESCVVLAREDTPGDKRLVGYLVAEPADGQIETGQVAQWQTTFDQAYHDQDASTDPTFNITGWQSSYTGQPIPAPEMEQWVKAAVTQIMALEPERVLEIGCGTGLLLARIAPHCAVYHGTDYARSALAHVTGLQQSLPELAHVTLSQRMADDFSGLEANSFDTIILNSVVQYFPSIDYLLTVIDGTMQVLKPGGRIYLGDVRSLPLLEAYHASVQYYQAEDGLTLAELRQQVQQQLLAENELVIDPLFFQALRQQWPQISRVEIQPKAGQAHNELTRFRYEVVLHLADEDSATTDLTAPAIEWLNWTQQQLTLTELRQQLAEQQPARLGVRGVPNSRLEEECQLLAWLAAGEPDQRVTDLRQQPTFAPTAVEPEQLWDLSGKLPYRVTVTWSAVEPEQGRLDVIFTRHDVTEAVEPTTDLPLRPWSAYANNPLHGQLSRELIPILRAHLQAQLPDYMVPSALVLLDSFPLTPNGKIDRQALPAPEWRAEADYVAPQTPTQASLAAIWAEVLGVERVGIHDDFFDLGGHSLLATQLIAKIRATFPVDLPLRTLFETPTIAALAKLIDQPQPAEGAFKARVLSRPLPPYLISLQTEGKRPPLFLLHPVAGVVFPYFELAQLLDDEQPVYGLQSVGLAGEGPPLTRIESMAETYLEAIRQVQPEGPYQLAGWSFGGLVALEMAQQLHRAGQAVSLLAIIDTAITASTLGASKMFLTTVLPFLWPYVSDYLAQQSAQSEGQPSWLVRKLGALLRKKARADETPTLDFNTPEVQRLLRVLRANIKAGRQYKAERYPGQVTLFKTAISHPSVTWGWGDIAGSGVDLYDIPGHHMNVLHSPRVEVLAETLAACLVQPDKGKPRFDGGSLINDDRV